MVALTQTSATAMTSDIPSLVEASLDGIQTNSMGPTDIWLCSDMQTADWNLDSGRWNRIRQRLAGLPGTKLRILSPPPATGFNLAVSVRNVNRLQKGERFYLEMDITVQQTHGEINTRTIPITIRVAGTERRLNADLIAGRYDARRIQVELPDDEAKGGGMIQLPADANAEDNTWFFSYAPPAPRRTVVVSDDDDVRSLIELVCTTSQIDRVSYECDLLPVSRSHEVNWAAASMIVWHTELPDGQIAEKIQDFVASGRTILFLPPAAKNQNGRTSSAPTSRPAMFDVTWNQWENNDQSPAANEGDSGGFQVTTWRRNDDLLATDSDGQELPVNELICQQRCPLESKSAATLAAFADGHPLLVRAATRHGGAYFMTTLPTADYGNFLDNGIVLFVMMHRCLDAGAAAGSVAQHVDAGQLADTNTRNWKPLDAISRAVPSSERPFHAGLYSSGGQLLAINRSLDEDNPETLEQASIAEVLGENSFDLVSAGSTNLSSLASELWKPFAILVIIALFAEGWMSLPAKVKKAEHQSLVSVSSQSVTANTEISHKPGAAQSTATTLQETS